MRTKQEIGSAYNLLRRYVIRLLGDKAHPEVTGKYAVLAAGLAWVLGHEDETNPVNDLIRVASQDEASRG